MPFYLFAPITFTCFHKSFVTHTWWYIFPILYVIQTRALGNQVLRNDENTYSSPFLLFFAHTLHYLHTFTWNPICNLRGFLCNYFGEQNIAAAYRNKQRKMSLSRTRANLAFLQPDGMAAKQTAAKKSEVAPLRLFFQKMRPPQKSRMLTGETASPGGLRRHRPSSFCQTSRYRYTHQRELLEGWKPRNSSPCF